MPTTKDVRSVVTERKTGIAILDIGFGSLRRAAVSV